MIQRIEPLRKKAQRIELFFFFEYDSQNRNFLNVTQIEIFGWKLVKKTQNWFFSHDPKNRTRFFSIWLKELNLFLLDSKIWCYSVWPKELNFFWLGLTELDPFLEYDSENWNFSWVFYMSTFFKNDAENWTLFSLNMTQRIEPFSYLKQRNELLFLWYEWLQEFFFKQKYSMNWTFWNMTQRIEHLNHVSKKYSESGTLLKWFFEMTHRIEPLFLNLFKMTQRVEVFLQYDSKSSTFLVFQYDSKNWTIFFFKLTQRIVCFLIWLKELNPFSLNMTQRIEPFVFLNKKCSKNWTSFSFELLFTWLNELNFFQFDSKSWVFSNMTQRVGLFFLNMTQKLEPSFEHDSWLRSELFWTLLRESNPFFKTTQRIEPFSKSDSKNWPFLKMTQRIETFF